jgi:hypothetical protein
MSRSSAAIRTSRPAISDHAAFLDRLSNLLRAREYTLVRAEFGREATRAVWMLTIQLPNQHVLTLRAPLEPSEEPFSPKVCEDIAKRVIAHLAK